jgi:hypothetical protein
MILALIRARKVPSLQPPQGRQWYTHTARSQRRPDGIINELQASCNEHDRMVEPSPEHRGNLCRILT